MTPEVRGGIVGALLSLAALAAWLFLVDSALPGAPIVGGVVGMAGTFAGVIAGSALDRWNIRRTRKAKWKDTPR